MSEVAVSWLWSPASSQAAELQFNSTLFLQNHRQQVYPTSLQSLFCEKRHRKSLFNANWNKNMIFILVFHPFWKLKIVDMKKLCSLIFSRFSTFIRIFLLKSCGCMKTSLVHVRCSFLNGLFCFFLTVKTNKTNWVSAINLQLAATPLCATRWCIESPKLSSKRRTFREKKFSSWVTAAIWWSAVGLPQCFILKFKATLTRVKINSLAVK